MNRLATFAFALTAIGLAAAPAGADVAVPDHIVVFDAPNDFPATAAKLGYTKIEALALESVAIGGYRVRVPSNVSAGAMIQILKAHYPSATVDAEENDFALTN